jgi:cell wall assembly regulator SMI1
MATSWPAMSERGPQLTEAAITKFEARLGALLPDDYREFLLEVNGGRTARSRRVFTIRTGKARTDETVLNSLNSLDDTDDRSDLATRWKRACAWLPREVIPVGYDGFGGTVVVVIAGPRRGQVWFLDGYDPDPEGANPRVAWFDRRDVSKVADSFREFMVSLRPLEG